MSWERMVRVRVKVFCSSCPVGGGVLVGWRDGCMGFRLFTGVTEERTHAQIRSCLVPREALRWASERLCTQSILHIVWSIRQQVHRSLQTPEPGPRAVLVMVRPGCVGGEVGAGGKPDVHVEGHDQVGCFVDFSTAATWPGSVRMD